MQEQPDNKVKIPYIVSTLSKMYNLELSKNLYFVKFRILQLTKSCSVAEKQPLSYSFNKPIFSEIVILCQNDSAAD